MSVSSAIAIADMQKISSPSAGDVVEVAGYRSAADSPLRPSDDGGGGTFFFDTTQIVAATVRSVNITGATRSDGPTDLAPIVITAVAHDFVNGQAVLVQGVEGVGGGDTKANGAWLIQIPLIGPDPQHLRPDPDAFALLGSRRSNVSYKSGGTATSVTVTTGLPPVPPDPRPKELPHGLSPGGRATIERVTGSSGFSLNGSHMPIGTATPTTFTLALAPTGSYSGGGAVGDGGVLFPSTKINGCWVRRRDDAEINVKWFGAVGDGNTDDTDALVATVRAARTLKTGVYFPGGNFMTTAEIQLETSIAFTDLGLSIRGEGSEQNVHGGTQLTASRPGMRSILSVRAVNVTIKGVSFECAAKADHGLYLQGASKLHLDDVHVLNAVKDGYRVAAIADDGAGTLNDDVFARELNATKCGTMYCSPSVADRYIGKAVIPVDGTVSRFVPDPNPQFAAFGTIIGSGTRFKSIPARPGDFILVGAQDDSTLQRFEIAHIDDEDKISVNLLKPTTSNLAGQPFAIGVGDGWSDELLVTRDGQTVIQSDSNRARMDTGHFTHCAGSGIVCHGAYGPLLEHQEFLGCGFAGIVIGTLSLAPGVNFNTRISNPYFEATPFYGGCILLAQARGITIDQPMWQEQPDHRRLTLGEFANVNSGIIGYLADFVQFPDRHGTVGLHPLGNSTKIDVAATRGINFMNDGTLTLPSSGAAVIIDSSPWKTPIRTITRNLNIVMDRGKIDGPADITAIPTFPAGVDGQEIAVCNVAEYPLTFHDSRPLDAPNTTLVLDCEPGGNLSLEKGQIMMLYYSTANSMSGKWTQRGAIATEVPFLSSLNPPVAGVAGGDLITITGTNLSGVTEIRVGSAPSTGPITITEPTATSLKFIMPARSAGIQNVLVRTGRGASNILPIDMR